MPLITDMSQESAYALTSCVAEGAPGPIRVITAPQAFDVPQGLYDCWEGTDLDALVLPNCRANSPCYSPQCGPVAQPPTITSISPSSVPSGSPTTTFTVTGTNFVAPLDVSWTGSAGNGSAIATVVSPTEVTFAVTSAFLDTPDTMFVPVITTEGGSATAPNAIQVV